MGASLSSNVTKAVINAVTTVTSNVIQNANITTDTSQIIHVSDVEGDVVIKGTKQYQKVNLNMNALFSSLATVSNQQKIAESISQQAKAVVSGINLGQVAGVSNFVNSVITGSMHIASTLSTTCSANVKQTESIVVERVLGKVSIQNAEMMQISDILSKCIENAVNQNTTIQDAIATFKNSATAETMGISEWAVVITGALLIGAPVVGGTIGGIYALKYIFPIILVVGVVLIGLYFFKAKEPVKLTAFANMMSTDANCAPFKEISTATATDLAGATSMSDAAAKCQANSQCQAFEYKTYDIDNTTKAVTPISSPVVKYFSEYKSTCKPVVDNAKLFRIPAVTAVAANGTPPASPAQGDVYIKADTAKWYQYVDTIWKERGVLHTAPLTNLLVTNSIPANTVGAAGDFAVVTDPNNRLTFAIYSKVTDAWRPISTKSGPGPYAITPTMYNTVGMKVKERNPWFLYSGIGLALVGLIGTGVTMYKASQDQE